MAAVMRGRVALLRVASPPVNAISLAVRQRLMQGIDDAEKAGAKVIVISGAGATFPAGADISEFASGGHLTYPTLNSVVERISGLQMHTIAAMHGTALGGGLELALACQWRVAHPQAQCGLPEVQLGLLPGAGGTQRLPRLVGLPQAIHMITSGLPVRAPAALKSGLIDEISTSDPTVSPDEAIAECGFALGERLQDLPWDNTRVLSSRKVPAPEEGLEACFASATERVRKAARGAEAPMVALEALRAATESGSFELGLRREADLFLQLAMGEQAAALQHAFFADRQMSKVEGLRAPPALVESVVVVGGGTMGSGIAMSFANAGIPVTIVELSQQAMDRGMQLIEGYYKASQSKGKLSEAEANARIGLIRASTQYDVAAVREADLVVEAAFEKMEVKKQVFAQLDALCKPSAILASNTSYLDIDEIASATSRPHAVAGMHFFSPAHVMPLLENVRGKATDAVTVATIMAVGKRLKKKAVLASNAHGFIGNRMLEGYVTEALYMLEEGCYPAEIDRPLRSFGMPMGPLELSDLAGNDISYLARRNAPKPEERYPGGIADRLVEMGRLGQKASAGWYDYSQGKTPLEDPAVASLIDNYRTENGIAARLIKEDEVIDRCLLPLVNEGFKVLEAGIAQRESDIDMVYLYGYGFPRFKGGPMFWARHGRPGGLPKVLADLEKFSSQHPSVSHWKPANLLKSMASGKSAL